MPRTHLDAPRPDVCVCAEPRLTGNCATCTRPAGHHMPNECRACHHPVINLPETE